MVFSSQLAEMPVSGDKIYLLGLPLVKSPTLGPHYLLLTNLQRVSCEVDCALYLCKLVPDPASDD